MTNLFFPDLSQSYQPKTTWSKLRQATSVVSIEASWGTKVTATPAFVAAARAQVDDLIIWYMGLVPARAVAGQVAIFLSAIGELGPNESVFIDWETTPGAGVPSVSMLGQALATLARATGRPPATIGRYSDEAMLPESSGLPGWSTVAEYGGPEPTEPHTIWQFTDGAHSSKPTSTYGPINWPGVGSIDSNVFHGSVAALKAIVLPAVPVHAHKELKMFFTDETSGKIIATDVNGEFYAEPGIPGLGVTTLEQHPTWDAGTAESHGANPCVGILGWKDPSGAMGYCYVTQPTSGSGGFGPYDLYHVGRDGTPH